MDAEIYGRSLPRRLRTHTRRKGKGHQMGRPQSSRGCGSVHPSLMSRFSSFHLVLGDAPPHPSADFVHGRTQSGSGRRRRALDLPRTPRFLKRSRLPIVINHARARRRHDQQRVSERAGQFRFPLARFGRGREWEKYGEQRKLICPSLVQNRDIHFSEIMNAKL